MCSVAVLLVICSLMRRYTSFGLRCESQKPMLSMRLMRFFTWTYLPLTISVT